MFVLHGDDEITELFAGRIRDELGLQASAPYNGESWDLTQDTMLKEGNRHKIDRKPQETKPKQPAPQPKKAAEAKPHENAAYGRLLDGGRTHGRADYGHARELQEKPEQAGERALCAGTKNTRNDNRGGKYMTREKAQECSAEKLVAQMTLDEKAAQLTYHAAAVPRLGVPAYNWWNEALHGVARAGTATVFPQAIGMAAVV